MERHTPLWPAVAFGSIALSCASVPSAGNGVPLADHHQHLFSPAIVALVSTSTSQLPQISARNVIALLDSAGIRRAVILSVAYMYGSPARNVVDEHAKVRAENDWTAEQAAQYPKRLVAFCGLNPLKPYAMEELARCSRHPGLRHGVKLHFGNSDVQLENPEHASRVRRVFERANDYRMAIVVHMRASISRQRPYGAAQARVFLEQLLPAATDITVQIAHLAGTGPGYNDPPADSVLAFLADAMHRGDPRTRNLWFDVTTVAAADMSSATAALLARRIREVGIERILFGSDAATGGNLRPRQSWAAFRRVPLTEAEFEQIAANVAPYLR